jgi:lipoprotein-anchoring transpeptidase ErfK/SrfK
MRLPALLAICLALVTTAATGQQAEDPPPAVVIPPAETLPPPPSVDVEPPPAVEAPAESAAPVDLSPATVNAAIYDGTPLPDGASAIALKLQVLLDRAGFSPGVIDGVIGDNVAKAVTAAESVAGLPQDGVVDTELWKALMPFDDQAVLVTYRITPEDAAGPYVPNLPSDYAALSKLPESSYRTPREMLAERFHMDEDLLASLNPNADFGAAGTEIIVAAPGAPVADRDITYLIADKTRKQLLGYDAGNRLVVSYPATIGSQALPSPSGTHAVNEIVPDPAYYYRPDVNFQQGDNTEPLTVPPGPNNPVGSTWIDLTEPTYGIHGTPEPSRIDKTNSHGCVRLTNWDAVELATLIMKGVPVEFR